MQIKRSDSLTRTACCIGFITQAVTINLAPLYFVIFRENYGISTGKLSLLITVNFLTQLLADLFSVKFSTKIGLKRCAVGAHLFCAVGLCTLAFLPRFTALTYSGMLLSTVLYSIGAGLLETVINPIFSALPQKESGVGLAFMHSFYCFGHMATVLLTTVLLKLFGEGAWWVIAFLWAAVPAVNALLLAHAPIREPSENEARDALTFAPAASGSDRRYVVFGIALCLLMITAAGATEQAMSQWASYFAEIALSVDKTLGDLLGVCLYALFMAIGRVLMGLYGKKLGVFRAVALSGVASLFLYAAVGLLSNAVFSLAACALTGLAVSILWPSVLDMAGERYGASPRIFGMMSLFGDMGCMLGPSLAGEVASFAEGSTYMASLSDALGIPTDALAIRVGLLASMIFPLILLVSLGLFGHMTKRKRRTV